MYKKQVKKLILFFILMIIADQATYASMADQAWRYASYANPQNCVPMTNAQREKQRTILAQANTITKSKKNITQAEQELAKAEALKAQLESMATNPQESENVEQEGFFQRQLTKAKQTISTLKQKIIENQTEIMTVAGILATAAAAVYLAGGDGLSEEENKKVENFLMYMEQDIRKDNQEDIKKILDEMEKEIELFAKTEKDKKLGRILIERARKRFLSPGSNVAGTGLPAFDDTLTMEQRIENIHRIWSNMSPEEMQQNLQVSKSFIQNSTYSEQQKQIVLQAIESAAQRWNTESKADLDNKKIEEQLKLMKQHIDNNFITREQLEEKINDIESTIRASTMGEEREFNLRVIEAARKRFLPKLSPREEAEKRYGSYGYGKFPNE